MWYYLMGWHYRCLLYTSITAPQGDKLNRMAVDFEEIKSKVEFNTEL